MDVQPGSASASNLKIDQSESRKLSVFSNLTRKQSTAIGAKKKRITKGEVKPIKFFDKSYGVYTVNGKSIFK